MNVGHRFIANKRLHLHFKRAILRLFESFTSSQVIKHLLHRHAGIGSSTQCHDFPQQDAEGPHVTLGGEDTIKQSLWCHPLDRQSTLKSKIQRMFNVMNE